MFKYQHLLLLPFLFCYQTSHADILEYNHAFSYFEFGVETISYGERTTIAGNELNMAEQVSNPVQRSGGYTPFSENTGFYVETSSTLDPLPTREYWDVSPYGVVQNNDRKVRLNELNLLFSWLADDSAYHIVSGIGVTTLNFTRSDFQKDVGAAAFDAAIKAADPTNPNAGFGVESGAISEDSTNVVASIGIRYDSTFLNPDEESRWLAGIMVGVPVYYKVENSNFPGLQWVEYFNGYDIQANVGYGFKIYNNFMFSTHLSALYKTRAETEKLALNATQKAWVPEVTVWSIRATAGLEWVF